MQEFLKAVAHGILVQQSIRIGTRLINNKPISDSEKLGF
jgi:hypothetical protein